MSAFGLFKWQSNDLTGEIESIVKLIRSKSVGVLISVPISDRRSESILGSLGLKVADALRAFTAKDRKAISKDR